MSISTSQWPGSQLFSREQNDTVKKMIRKRYTDKITTKYNARSGYIKSDSFKKLLELFNWPRTKCSYLVKFHVFISRA